VKLKKSKLYELRSGYTAAEKADESEADSTIEQAFNTLEAQPSIKSTIVDPKATDVVAQAKVAVNN
jgi:hypothetical protein